MSTKPFVEEAIQRDSALLLGELDRLLEAMPAKLAPLIAAEPDETKRRAIIDGEVLRIRLKIETATQAMVDRYGKTEH